MHIYCEKRTILVFLWLHGGICGSKMIEALLGYFTLGGFGSPEKDQDFVFCLEWWWWSSYCGVKGLDAFPLPFPFHHGVGTSCFGSIMT